MAAPSWTTLAYKLASDSRDPSEPTGRLVQVLPSLLSTGAGPLEIARRAQAPPEKVETLLQELAAYRLVETHASGSSLQYASTIYSLSSEGQQFFRQLYSLMGSNSPTNLGR